MRLLVPNNLSFLFLLGSLGLIPFAHMKQVFFGIPLYLPEITIFLSAVLLSLEHPFENRRWPEPLFLAGMLCFVIGALISFLLHPFSLTGLGMLKSWFLFPALFGLVVFWHAQQEGKRRVLLLSWFLVLVAIAVANLTLFFQGFVTYDHRLAGSYASPNFLAILLAPAILLAFFFLVESRGHFSRFTQGLILLGGALVLLVLFLTKSYQTWGALLGSLGFLVVLLFRFHHLSLRRGKWLILILLMGAALFMAFEQGSEKWQSLIHREERSSFASRVMIWQAATRIAIEHPIFGIGVGRFQEEYLTYQKYFPPYLEWAVPEPHNIVLAVFLSTGLLGLVGFLCMIIHFIRCFFSAEKNKEGILFVSLLCLVLLYGLTDTPYFKNDLALLFFFILSLGLAAFQKKHPSIERAA